MNDLTNDDLKVISEVLSIRVWHVERKINQHERKELNDARHSRRVQIDKYLAEAETLLGIVDKIDGDA